MGLFSREQEPQDRAPEQDYDPARYELVEVDGRDDQGHTYHEYIRDRQTQRLVGELTYAPRVRRLDGERRRR